VETDPLVFHEELEEYHLTLKKCTSERFIQVVSSSYVSTSVRVIPIVDDRVKVNVVDADKMDCATTIFPKKPHVECILDHHSDGFYLLTNENATNFRLVKIPSKDCQDTSLWKVLWSPL
jgi:oligopeptidase B